MIARYGCVDVKVDVVGLDVKQTQRAGLACDINSSLIYIEIAGEAVRALPLAARRIRRQVRRHDSVLLLERACALLLPSTSFAGAQTVASRILPLLTDVPCELQVYHGATALLVLQRLHEAGAEMIAREESLDLPAQSLPDKPAKTSALPLDPLPYLAFLNSYPSPRLLQMFPYDLARRYQCVPVGAERNKLTLATCHWLDRKVVTQLHTATRRRIFQVRCEMTMIDEVLRYWQDIQETLPLADVELAREEVYSSR